MKMERLNAWLGLAGNVAVLLGLVALAVEINANTKALRVQISEQTFAIRQERLLATASDVDFQKLRVKLLLSPSELTPSELWGALAWLESRLAYTERSFSRYKEGLMTEDAWKGDLASVSYYLGGAFGRVVWSNERELYAEEDAEFVAAVDGQLAMGKGKGLSNEEYLIRLQEQVAKLDL